MDVTPGQGHLALAYAKALAGRDAAYVYIDHPFMNGARVVGQERLVVLGDVPRSPGEHVL